MASLSLPVNMLSLNEWCKDITVDKETRLPVNMLSLNFEKLKKARANGNPSACKHVVAERCKQAGMRWTQTGINAILFWRCLLKNDAWDTYWDTQAKQNAA